MVKDEAVLPRSKLSRSHELFGQMLSLIEGSTGDEAEALWDLLMSLPTNESIYKQVLSNEGVEQLLGLGPSSDAQGGSGLYRVLYCLQLVQSLVFEYKSRSESKVVAYVEEGLAAQPASANDQSQPPAEQQSAAMAVDSNYENEFPALDALDEGTSPTSMYRVDSEPQHHASVRAQEPSPECEPQADFKQPGQSTTERDPNQAIPLPYAGPLLPQSQPQASQLDYDVPMAPPSQAAAVGPPSQQNTLPQNSTFSNFQGRQVVHVYTASSEDGAAQAQARKDWLPDFLAGNGLEKLVNLLKNLSHYHFSGEGENAEPAPSASSARIAKRCLAEVLSTIKVLLVSSFCARQADSGLALQLQRKLSGAGPEERQEQRSSGQAAQE